MAYLQYAKIFAYETSLSSKFHNINKSVKKLNADLNNVSQWVS